MRDTVMRYDPVLAAALAPVREALLASARREAEGLRSRADLAAERTIADASALAARLRGEARAQGAADAAAAVASERARAGRQAREIVLRARRDEFETLRADVRRELARVREDPDYPHARLRMINVVRGLLGSDVRLEDGDEGGVVGAAPGRRVDCSLALFADRAVETVIAEHGAWMGTRTGPATENRPDASGGAST